MLSFTVTALLSIPLFMLRFFNSTLFQLDPFSTLSISFNSIVFLGIPVLFNSLLPPPTITPSSSSSPSLLLFFFSSSSLDLLLIFPYLSSSLFLLHIISFLHYLPLFHSLLYYTSSMPSPTHAFWCPCHTRRDHIHPRYMPNV